MLPNLANLKMPSSRLRVNFNFEQRESLFKLLVIGSPASQHDSNAAGVNVVASIQPARCPGQVGS